MTIARLLASFDLDSTRMVIRQDTLSISAACPQCTNVELCNACESIHSALTQEVN